MLSSFAGTGKTGVYLIPMLENLSYYWEKDPPENRLVRAVVLVPNTELACQVKSIVDKLALDYVKVACLTRLLFKKESASGDQTKGRQVIL